MKHFLIILFSFLVITTSNAQYTIRLVVNEVAAKKQDDIYVTGNFNNWNPRDDEYKLRPFGV